MGKVKRHEALCGGFVDLNRAVGNDKACLSEYCTDPSFLQSS